MRAPRLPTFVDRRIAVGALLLAASTALALHWRPTRQVELHQRNFLRALEDRNWKKFGDFIAPTYSDRWKHHRETLLKQVPTIFGDFFACGVLAEGSPVIAWRNQDATVMERVRIVGSGGPLAQLVIERSDSLKEPFVFTWRRQGWRPWDWRLVAVDQPEIEIPPDVDSLPGPPAIP